MRSILLRFCTGLAILTVATTGLSGSAATQRERGGVPPASATLATGLKAAPPGPLPALPYDGYPAPRPMEVVNKVYEFAARHPDVLQYMPCFCGCDRSAGHKANVDCFVKRRAADGRIMEWDSHGYGCAVCIDVARDSMQMFNSGASLTSIRTAIDAKYGAQAPPTMQTPKPPAAVKPVAAVTK